MFGSYTNHWLGPIFIMDRRRMYGTHSFYFISDRRTILQIIWRSFAKKINLKSLPWSTTKLIRIKQILVILLSFSSLLCSCTLTTSLGLVGFFNSFAISF